MKQTQNTKSEHKFNIKETIFLIVILVAIGIIAFTVLNITRGNADYICTHIIEENGDCSDGEWSQWQTISTKSDTNTCKLTGTERRVYTGTRTTRHILQYLNLRTSCEAGYTQTGNGSYGGASGFHGGNIISQTSACQIEQVRTTMSLITTDVCANKRTSVQSADKKTMQVDVDTKTTQVDIGNSAETQQSVSSLEMLNELRASYIAADITAIPSLVRKGKTSNIRWQGREVTECEVLGTNGDKWSGTSGEEVSSALNEETSFTLTCQAFNGTKITQSVTVKIIPEWKEF